MERSKKYCHPLYEKPYGEFTWCLHCECVYRTELWVKNDWDCPDGECDGGALDAFPWSVNSWPRCENPDYPEIPVEGKLYPLYGDACQ